MKKYVIILLVSALAVSTLFVGISCKGEAAQEKIILTWAVPTFEERLVTIPEEIASMYMEKHPNVEIIVSPIPPDEFYVKMPTLVAAGEVPDILFNDSDADEEFATQGVTLDLTPYLTSGDREKDPLQVEDFPEFFIGINTTYGGEIHTLPVALDVYVMFYNKRIFDEAGLEYPTNDWTYDDFTEYAIALTKPLEDGTTQYGWAIDPTYGQFGIMFPLGEGFDMQVDENDEWNFNTPEAKKGWEVLLNGLLEGYAMPIDEINEVGGYLGAFALGKAAMVPAARWGCPVFRDMEDDWDVVLMPKGSSGKNAANGGSFGYSVGATTKYPEAALDFLWTIYSDEAYELWTENYSTVPSVKSIYETGSWRDLPGPPYSNDVFIEALDYMDVSPTEPWFQFTYFNFTIYPSIVEEYVLGGDLQEILDKNVELMNTDIKERKAEFMEMESE